MKRWFATFFRNTKAKAKLKGLFNNSLFCFRKNKDFLNKLKSSFKLFFKRKRFSKNGNLYFGIISIILFLITCSSCETFASFNGSDNNYTVFLNSFFDDIRIQNKEGLFLSQREGTELQTPNLKIIQDNTLGGVSTPYIVSTKVLGNVFGGNSKNDKAIIEHVVQPGDTLKFIAESYDVSTNTILWANELTSSSTIKVGQSLVILPIDGVLHFVKSGDTIIDIAKKYSTKEEDIISFNDLKNQDDIYIGDILIIPNGIMPKKVTSLSVTQKNVANSYFMNPTTGTITQLLHYYNAIDVANKCGTSIYAAASGTVQRVKYGYNFGGGNLVTILHPNGTVTYYGHLMTIFVKSGDKVNMGDRIALMGGGTGTVGDGISTGCHLHFQVTGAKNPLSVYAFGAKINIK